MIFGESCGRDGMEKKKKKKEEKGTEARDDKGTNSWVVRSSSGTRSSRERAVCATRSTGRSEVSCFVRNAFHSYS